MITDNGISYSNSKGNLFEIPLQTYQNSFEKWNNDGLIWDIGIAGQWFRYNTLSFDFNKGKTFKSWYV